MYDLLDALRDYPTAELLIGFSIVLILIDYYFPVDLPAHIGYFCFGAGIFFLVPLAILPSMVMALAVWLSLAILHFVWFRKFLTNAPNTFGSSKQ